MVVPSRRSAVASSAASSSSASSMHPSQPHHQQLSRPPVHRPLRRAVVIATVATLVLFFAVDMNTAVFQADSSTARAAHLGRWNADADLNRPFVVTRQRHSSPAAPALQHEQRITERTRDTAVSNAARGERHEGSHRPLPTGHRLARGRLYRVLSESEVGMLQPSAAPEVTCTAASPYEHQRSMYDYEFYERYLSAPKPTNFALLMREAKFWPELSPSPFVQNYTERRVGDEETREVLRAATDRVREAVLRSSCHATTDDEEARTDRVYARGANGVDDDEDLQAHVYLVASCRDRPKRALEFVAYHLLLGVDKVVLLDLSSLSRPALPALSRYLVPWIEAGFVEIVTPPQFQSLIRSKQDDTNNNTSNPADNHNINNVVVSSDKTSFGSDVAPRAGFRDYDEAESLRVQFVTETARRIANVDAHATVLSMLDVETFLVITASVETRGADDHVNTTTTKTTTTSSGGGGGERRSPSSSIACIADLVSGGASGSPRASSHVWTVPVVSVGSEALYDNSRTPFERVGFATGSSKEMLRSAVWSVGTLRPLLLSLRDSTPRNTADVWKKMLGDFLLLGSATSMSQLMNPSQRRQQHKELASPPPVLRASQRLAFLDGSTWDSVVSTARFRSQDAVAFSARVLRIALSNQEQLERVIDTCYRAAVHQYQGGGGGWQHHQQQRISLASRRMFDVNHIRPVVGNNVDDLPRENSLRWNGFLALHQSLLELLQYPAIVGRRERAVAKSNVAVQPMLRHILRKVTAYGRPAISALPLPEGTSVVSGHPHPAVVNNAAEPPPSPPSPPLTPPPPPAFPVDVALEDITNDNLVSGVVRLNPETPLSVLNRSRVEREFHRVFNDATLACDGQRGREPHSSDETHSDRHHGRRSPDCSPATDVVVIGAATATVCPNFSFNLTATGHRRGRSALNLTFCCVVRNRAKLTLEWVLYHKLYGVGRFVILDDNSTDGLGEVLRPLVEMGTVELLPADDGSNMYRFRDRVVKGPLLAGYGTCVARELERARRERHASAPWIGFIDSDEFVVIPDGRCIPSMVHDAAAGKVGNGEEQQRKEQQQGGGGVAASSSSTNVGVGAVALSWRNVAPMATDIFDHSPTQFHRTAFSRGVADSIQRVKVIARSDAVLGMDTAHKVDLAGSLITVFPNGKEVKGPGWFTGSNEETEAGGVLFHYHSRSLVSWLQRYLDGFADNNNHIWPFDVNTYYGRWFHDTSKSFAARDRVWLESIPGWKERMNVLLRLLLDADEIPVSLL